MALQDHSSQRKFPRTLIVLFYWLLFCTGIEGGQEIAGFWKSVNDKSGKPECIIAIYKYEEKYYGRIIGSYDDTGTMNDTIYDPKGRAPGVRGEPFYCGMDIIWNLSNKGKGSRYRGKILDPKRGNIYTAELWIKNDNLIVRGQILFLGQNREWIPALDSDFPADFKKPNLTEFIPSIPQVK